MNSLRSSASPVEASRAGPETEPWFQAPEHRCHAWPAWILAATRRVATLVIGITGMLWFENWGGGPVWKTVLGVAMKQLRSDESRYGETPSILTKAFDLLRAFNSRERVMTLSELSRASGLPKSTVHRLIPRLIDLGAIERHRAGYRIGLGLLELGVTTPAGSMRDRAMPYLAALHRETRRTVHFAVLRQFDVVYLETLSHAGSPPGLTGVGSRLPANCTAIGKALLAWEDFDYLEASLPSPMPTMTPSSTSSVAALLPELRRVRAERVAYERNEAQLGTACVAVPVIMYDFAVAAVSVSYDADTRLGTKVEWMLHETAAGISAECRDRLTPHPHWFPKEH